MLPRSKVWGKKIESNLPATVFMRIYHHTLPSWKMEGEKQIFKTILSMRGQLKKNDNELDVLSKDREH